MIRHLHHLARDIQARLLDGGGPRVMKGSPEWPVLRDAWASLYLWHCAGERIWRLRGDEPDPPQDIDMATAPVHAPGMCYVGPDDRSQWIIIARHGALDQIPVQNPDHVYAYDAPAITYATVHGTSLASGAINLTECPTWRDIWIAPGALIRRASAIALSDEQRDADERRLMIALRRYYHE